MIKGLKNYADLVPDSFAKERLMFDVWNWFILTVIVLIFFAIVFASTLHLLSFHIMLFFNNQTTFSYIVKQRTKNKVCLPNFKQPGKSEKLLTNFRRPAPIPPTKHIIQANLYLVFHTTRQLLQIP